MRRAVVLTEKEWRELPIRFAEAIAEGFERDGYKVLDGDGGVVTRLRDYLVGTMALIVYEDEDE